jgi:predicted AAA+ superfamily ATPase
MAKTSWTPWHEVVRLRDDLRTGDLALNEFAADLYDVALRRGSRPIYEEPHQFFNLTYPTTALRELAKDVVHRLAGKNQKAVRQLELTYGGGKTHTLITLYHLVYDPDALPDVAAVREFKAHIDLAIPRARISVLPFDKIDVEKGMVARSPTGEERMLRKPWSILAWQLAGVDGLRLLHADDKDEERQSAPAENLLRTLLEMPVKEGLSTLVLLDEVLMFARGAVDVDTGWTERLKNFFQALTQAATKRHRRLSPGDGSPHE